MIINCTKCYKKFELNSDLIPNEGRLVECGACHHQWLFKKENKIAEPIILDDEIELNKKDFPEDNADVVINNIETNKVKDPDIVLKDEKTKEVNKKTNILYILLIFVISISAAIILIDTFQYPLSKIFPNVEMFLYSLYESITDIKLFFINLF